MEAPRQIRYRGAVIIIGITIALIFWMYATAFTIRANIAAIAVIFAAFMLSVWWSFWIGRHRKDAWFTFGRMLVLWIAAFGAFRVFFRIEGTVSGSGLWKIVWRWTPEKGSNLADLPGTATSGESVIDEAALAAGVRDMPDFLGTSRNGVLSPGEFTLKHDWNSSPPREVWRKKVGVGWSGFSVKGGRAVTVEQRKSEEFVACYDVLTGEPLWSHVKPATPEVDPDGMGGPGPRSTPVIDGNKVYVTSSGGILECLDLETGSVLWSRDVLAELEAKLPTWGKSNAPLVLDKIVVATGGEGGNAGLAAYDKASGEPRWKGGSDGSSYSSPVLITLDGTAQIVVVNAESATGHDPASGAVLWRFGWPGGFPKVGQPSALGANRLLVTASYGAGSNLLEVEKVDGGWKVEPVWQTIKALKTKFSTATIIGDYAYAIDEGTLSCVSVADGKRVWKDGRYGFGQHLALGDLLVIQAERGEVVLVKASAEKLIELGRIKALSSKTWNPPCLAGKFLLLRNDEEAVCYELPVE